MDATGAHDRGSLDMRLGRVPHGPSHLPALVFPASVRRLAFAIAGSVIFMAFGVLLILIAGPDQVKWVVGAATVLVFGLFAIFGVYGIVRDVGRVALSAAGVHGGGRSDVFVPWSAVQGISPLTINRTSMVGLVVLDAPSLRIPRRLRVGQSLTRAMYGIDVAVGAPTDVARAWAVASVILYYAADTDRRREIGRVLPPAEALVAFREPDAQPLVR